jgi:hypothetical protein
MSEVIRRSEIIDWANDVGKADILVGIPSFNNARTIGHVVRAVQAGLAKYFPEHKAVLINSDGGSGDGTMDVVRNTVVDNFDSLLLHHRVRPLAKLATPYHGLPGKGSAFRTFFEIAAALEVKACAVVDSDLRSITPEWIELLIKPVLSDQFDYVAPLYKRHKYDGTITNSIIYPLTRALYGKRVRQPIGGDFGFSGELARLYRSKDVWESDVARFGIDIWMTTTALANNYRVCQSYLGAKIHDPKDPGADLSAMLFQVVGATFDLMETYAESWKDIHGSEPVPSFGFQYAVGLEPVNVNIERMLQNFRLGVQELGDFWQEILPGEIITELQRAADLSADRFHIPEELWVEIVQQFAVAAHRKGMNREHLLKSLTPLYIGRTASFVLETRESESEAVEEKIEALCQIYEAKKPQLLKSWA